MFEIQEYKQTYPQKLWRKVFQLKSPVDLFAK